MTRRYAGWVALLLLLFAGLLTLARAPLSADEGRALWAVRDDRLLTLADPLESLRALRGNLTDTLNRIPEQSQPLVGVLLLDAWTTLAGESLRAARLPGQLAALLAGSLVGGGPLGVLATGLLALIPAAQVGSQVWLLLASALALRVVRVGSPGWLLLAALLLALTTHRAGPLLIPLALGFALATNRAQSRRWLPWTLGALALAAPWLLLAPGGWRPLAGSAGEWLAGIVALLAPALAWGLSRLAARGAGERMAAAAIMGALALVSVGAGLQRTDWPAAVRDFTAQRSPTAPVVRLYAPQHPLAHYERLPGTDGLRQGISLDLGWREFGVDEVAAVAEALMGAPTIWLIAPADDPLAAALREALRPAYDTGHVITAGEMRFWRLDRGV